MNTLIQYLFIPALVSVAVSARADGLNAASIARTGPNNQPVIACTLENLNGMCLLDTGAGYSYISDTPESQTLRVVQKAQATGVNGTIEVSVVNVPNFDLSQELVVNNVMAVRTNNYPGLPVYVGMIGLNFFTANLKTWVLDFSGFVRSGVQELISLDANSQNIVSRFPQPERLVGAASGGRIRFGVSFAGTSPIALFDTGTKESTFSAEFVKRNPSLFTFVRNDKVGGAVKSGKELPIMIDTINQPICLHSGLCLASKGEVMVVPPKTAGFSDVDMILGMDVIDQAAWYFDFNSNVYSVAR